MKYLQKNLNTDMAIAIKSRMRPYFDISFNPAPSSVSASTTFSVIRYRELAYVHERQGQKTREKRIFIFDEKRE
ncbi:MAG: hypothetical protein F9K51_00660 [Candidatus Dadabacteria bacterium]|nr:MAG: hypothetical protein F9K51_00660 [Candidatus Dadabacteria bacterium]